MGELADEFAGDGVDDAYVEVLDEQDDVGSADADVAQLPVHAQGDTACFVDAVVQQTRQFTGIDAVGAAWSLSSPVGWC